MRFSQFQRVLLSALGQIIKSNAPEEFEEGKFMARKTSDTAIKLKATIDLYLSGCVKINQNSSIFELHGYHKMASNCQFLKL